MSITTISIILWSIPVSVLLGIIIWVSMGIHEEHKPIIKTWFFEIIPIIITTIFWLGFYLGLLCVFLYLWGKATQQFGILGFIGFIVLINMLVPSKK